MFMRYIFSILFLFVSSVYMSGQNLPNANELLQSSIKYHDPKGKLFSSDLRFDLVETRPNGTDRSTSIKCNIQKETFTSLQSRDSLLIESAYNKGTVKFKVNGSEDISDDIVKEKRLDKNRFLMLRNYYQYLWLLPVKLLDDGTVLDQKVVQADFFGKQSLQLRVTYEESVGDDIWYFYFHPDTHALIGYRFYHDEAANDGEYILLEGEMESKGVKIPKERKWYMHKDDKYLGADILDGFWVE